VQDDSARRFVRGHLAPLVIESVALGATVITDGWKGYLGLHELGYVHEPRSQRAVRALGEDPHSLLPAVHRIASPAKRWLLGTHQGSVAYEDLPSYLNEFVFRFNRRTSRSRGLLFYRVLELAVSHDRSVIARSLPTRAPAASRPCHPRPAAALQACSGLALSGPGAAATGTELPHRLGTAK
jgi:hypothetical protein